MEQGAVGQILHFGASDGSVIEFQQLPVHVESGHVALGRSQRRAAEDCRSLLLPPRQRLVLSQRGLCQSVIHSADQHFHRNFF